MKKVIIVDDSEAFRKALKETLKAIGNNTVIAEASNGAELLRILGTNKPDILFMDIEMPFVNGFEATESVLSVYPDVSVIGMSAYEKEKYIYKLIDMGAKGYLLKTSDNFEALESLMNDTYEHFVYSLEINRNMPLLKPEKQLLFIDKSDDAHIQFRHELRRSGFQIDKAQSLHEVKTALQEKKYEMIVLCENMTKTNPEIVFLITEFARNREFKLFLVKEDNSDFGSADLKKIQFYVQEERYAVSSIVEIT